MSFDYRRAFLVLAAVLAGCGSKVNITPDGGTGGEGGAPSAAACDGPSQCILVFKTCCGTCGVPELSDYVAINRDKAAAFKQAQCTGNVGCPACAAMENPNLFAFCNEGTCDAADVREHAVSACTTDSDCRLRYGAGCCEGTCSGSVEQLTVVNASLEDTLQALVCDENGPVCDECLPQYPPDAAPICLGGHCAYAPAD